VEELARGLADAGGWAVVVAMIAAIGTGIVRGWWVPGFVYEREAKRADEATTQAQRNTDQIRDLVEFLRHPVRPPGGTA
jgi:hypothetical protein